MSNYSTMTQQSIEGIERKMPKFDGDSPKDIHVVTARRLLIFNEINETRNQVNEENLVTFINEICDWELSFSKA